MEQDTLGNIREEIESPEAVETVRDGRGASRSALTRWVAERHLKSLPAVGVPSYERCQDRGCWGKASWSCPNCRQKACSAHRREHHCSLPYLPR
ncbi:MAG TPA: hypothetical protein VMW62_16150 [Chloroflexota bacterium]|nr:hypothetical protein [Chloroflexota bacterium]